MANTTWNPTRCLVAAALLLALTPSPGDAQNLLYNGRFDFGLTSWEDVDGTLSLSAADADSQAGSNAAKVVNASPDAFRIVEASQCVEGIAPGAQYYLRGQAKLEAGETAFGNAAMYLGFYPKPGCGGDLIDNTVYGDSAGTTLSRGVWKTLVRGHVAQGEVAPGGAKSALIFVALFKEDAGNVLTARFDNLLFGRVGLPLCDGLAPTIGGGVGADVIVGTAGPDVIVGLDGDDTIKGLAGADRICGGSGDDLLKGGSGDDVLRGDLGDDVLRGQTGKDALFGGLGEDALHGGGGADTLSGGLLLDTCSGGGGADTADGSCETVSAVP